MAHNSRLAEIWKYSVEASDLDLMLGVLGELILPFSDEESEYGSQQNSHRWLPPANWPGADRGHYMKSVATWLH
jgi:hypothetical protein